MLISPGIHLIVLPTPFPVGPINCYLLEGDLPTLVDAGVNTAESRRALLAGLREAGYGLGDIARIFITHGHLDHYGGAGFAASQGASVFAHAAAAPWVADHGAEVERRAPVMAAWLLQMGVSADTVEKMAAFRAAGMALGEGTGRCDVLQEGDLFRAGRDEWRVLYLPGHSLSDLVLWRERDGLVLGGDVLLRDISSNAFVEPPAPGRERVRSLPLYVDSLQRLSLLPARQVLPGHGQPVRAHRPLIQGRLDHHAKRKETVAGILAAGPQPVKDVSRRLFPHLKPGQLVLALSETLGHLDLLEAEGRIQIEDRDGVLYYSLIRR